MSLVVAVTGLLIALGGFAGELRSRVAGFRVAWQAAYAETGDRG